MRNRQFGAWGLGVAVLLVVSPAGGGVQREGERPTRREALPAGQMGMADLRPDEVPSQACLASTLCAIKDRIRWRTSPWTMDFCQQLADAVLKAAAREKLPPALIVAVMINESSLDARAVRVTVKNGTVYAKDGGLMGIRCILDREGRCLNGRVRGLSWNEVMSPTTNIALGAHALAYWRDVGGATSETVRVRGQGGVETRMRYRRCLHRDHPYWAHYNHGVRYIDHGSARLYPHHIAVLYYALSSTMQTDTGNLTSLRLSADQPGVRPKRADHPVGPRHLALFRTILNVGPLCGEFVTAQAGPTSATVPAEPAARPQPAASSASAATEASTAAKAPKVGPST